jgi:hypothetical protein
MPWLRGRRVGLHYGEIGVKAAVEYRIVPEFPNYRVGDDGSVWSKRRGKQHGSDSNQADGEWHRLTPTVHRGYSVAVLYPQGKMFLVQRLVLTSFIGECPAGMCAIPRNGDGTDCRLSNLRWDILHGEKIKHHKLTESEVLEIRDRVERGDVQRGIAEAFGVHQSTVSHIVHAKTWGWLTEART